jgi:hypothetical protein
MTNEGACSRLVLSTNRIGWLDEDKHEFRTVHGVYSPVTIYQREATEAEARDFFADRASVRAELSAYYAAPGDKGD